jgi:hypothetical protein
LLFGPFENAPLRVLRLIVEGAESATSATAINAITSHFDDLHHLAITFTHGTTPGTPLTKGSLQP